MELNIRDLKLHPVKWSYGGERFSTSLFPPFDAYPINMHHLAAKPG